MMNLYTIDYHKPLPLFSKQYTCFYSYAIKHPKIFHKRKIHSFPQHSTSNIPSNDIHNSLSEEENITNIILKNDITTTNPNYKLSPNYFSNFNDWIWKHIFKLILLSMTFISIVI